MRAVVELRLIFPLARNQTKSLQTFFNRGIILCVCYYFEGIQSFIGKLDYTKQKKSKYQPAAIFVSPIPWCSFLMRQFAQWIIQNRSQRGDFFLSSLFSHNIKSIGNIQQKENRHIRERERISERVTFWIHSCNKKSIEHLSRARANLLCSQLIDNGNASSATKVIFQIVDSNFPTATLYLHDKSNQIIIIIIKKWQWCNRL